MSTVNKHSVNQICSYKHDSLIEINSKDKQLENKSMKIHNDPLSNGNHPNYNIKTYKKQLSNTNTNTPDTSNTQLNFLKEALLKHSANKDSHRYQSSNSLRENKRYDSVIEPLRIPQCEEKDKEESITDTHLQSNSINKSEGKSNNDDVLAKIKNLKNPYDSVNDNNPILIEYKDNKQYIGNMNHNSQDSNFIIQYAPKDNSTNNMNNNNILLNDTINNNLSQSNNINQIQLQIEEELSIRFSSINKDLIKEAIVLQCKLCEMTFNKTLNDKTALPCGCFYCKACLRNKVINDTNHRIVLNQYEKIKEYSGANKPKCICSKEYDPSIVVNVFFPQEKQHYEIKANERFIKAMQSICCICSIEASKKTYLLIQANSNNATNALSCFEKKTMTHIVCKKCKRIYDGKRKDNLKFNCVFCLESHEYVVKGNYSDRAEANKDCISKCCIVF